MGRDSRFVSRKIVRLPNYDYSSPNAYLITVCTHEKACVFGSTQTLSPEGYLAQQELEAISQHHPQVYVEKYVVMPNHIHAIIRLETSTKENLSVPQIVGLYKAAVSRRAEKSLWQRSIYEHVIRNQAKYDKIWNYIENNPRDWELDRFYK